MSTKNKKKKLQLAVIDSITGTILSPDRLYVVLATECQLDKASNNDSDAAILAVTKGQRIDRTLLRILATTKLTPAKVRSLAAALALGVDKDSSGHLVLCTRVKVD